MNSIINIERMWSKVQELAGYTDPQIPYTRRSFSVEYKNSRAWLQQQFQDAGLVTRIDAGGNLIGHLEGSNKDLPTIITGSHTDTVVGGGRFDGVAGVIASLEVAQSLVENHEQLNHSLEVIDFLGEEPSDYGISCIGSQAMAGVLTPEMLKQTTPDGTNLAQAIDSMGGNSSKLIQPLRIGESIAGFFELHIEQGPVLEEKGIPIGIVKEIVGITRKLITITGQADHAGTTPMHSRHDALVGAAMIILRANELASSDSFVTHYLVATVGKVVVEPNNSNVIPGQVKLILEVRSNSQRASTDYLDLILDYAQQTANHQKLEINFQQQSQSLPTPCSPLIQKTIQLACEKNELHFQFISSGAGHDTHHMAGLFPSGMIFIPCKNGRSHCSEEWVNQEQIAAGTMTLLDAIKTYDKQNL